MSAVAQEKAAYLKTASAPHGGHGHAHPHPAQVHPTGSATSSSTAVVPKKVVGGTLPPIPAPFTFPFYYAFLSNADFFYLVPVSNVLPFLGGTGLSPALFTNGGTQTFACVTYDFQLYGGTFSAGPGAPVSNWCGGANNGPSASITQELELNIVTYPTAGTPPPTVTFQQFLYGEEQNKLYGNHRVYVPCDNPFAIQAGEQCFGEPKFLTSFYTNLPSANPTSNGVDAQEWGFQVNDPTATNPPIFTVVAKLSNIASTPTNPSPITEYGTLNSTMIGCRWNLQGPMNVYLFDPTASSPVTLTYGASTHPMGQALKALIGNTNPSAARTFVSSPAAIQSRAYYP